VQVFLTIFLVVTITLFAISILVYAIMSRKVVFSGSIDVSLIAGIVIITALLAILRTVFGKGNVS
jgi:hypothetical protein